MTDPYRASRQMNTLPNDYARCVSPCCLRDKCLRHTAPPREGPVPMAAFPGGEDCEGLISNERTDK